MQRQRKKHCRSCTGFLKCVRIQQVHVSPLHLKYVLQNKFLNFFPMTLSLHTVKSKSFIKSLVLTKFWPHHLIFKQHKKTVWNLLEHMPFRHYAQSCLINFHPLLILLLKEGRKLLLDNLITVQHTWGIKQKETWFW